jgi:SlyX protein
MAPMSEETRLDRRLTDLEVKASFTEDLLDQLNLVIYRQQQQIDRLILQLNQLRQQIPEDATSRGDPGHNPRSELPPHY